jgi:hypothetical protein
MSNLSASPAPAPRPHLLIESRSGCLGHRPGEATPEGTNIATASDMLRMLANLSAGRPIAISVYRHRDPAGEWFEVRV